MLLKVCLLKNLGVLFHFLVDACILFTLHNCSQYDAQMPAVPFDVTH